MDIIRIAARIAARIASLAPVELHGPFVQTSPDESTSFDIPFGFTGEFAKLLAKAISDPGSESDPELMQEIQTGPIPVEVEIGYRLDDEDFSPGEKGYPDSPDLEDGYGITITITHLAGYELSPEDQTLVNNAVCGSDRIGQVTLNDLVKENVHGTHYESFKSSNEPDYEPEDYSYDD